MGFEFKGMDKFTKKLKQFEKQAKEAVEGEVGLEQLFSEKFMLEKTKSKNIQAFIDESPLSEEKIEDIAQLDTPKMDEYVKNQTEFDDWSDILQSATNNYAANKLKNAGFKLR